MSNFKTAVILGDLHLPFQDKQTLNLGLQCIKQRKPDLVVQIGDLYDNFNWSRFYKSPDIISPRKEMELARKQSIELWKTIREYSPKSVCVQLNGNHDRERLEKMTLMLAPSFHSIVLEKARELMTFDGVFTVPTYRHSYETIIQGEKVSFMHGTFSTTIAHGKHYMTNVVLGHLHRGEIIPYKQGEKDLWAMNVGYMGNPYAPVFNYTKTILHGWTLGLGVIDAEGPKFLSKRALQRLFG